VEKKTNNKQKLIYLLLITSFYNVSFNDDITHLSRNAIINELFYYNIFFFFHFSILCIHN
jgi:hypothetical protein